jgi:hypothetical protein
MSEFGKVHVWKIRFRKKQLRKNLEIVTGKKKTIEKTKQRNHKKPEKTQREGSRSPSSWAGPFRILVMHCGRVVW